MRPEDLLEYDSEHLSKLTDIELTKLFEQYFKVTRPVKGQALANKVGGMVKNMVKTAKQGGDGKMTNINNLLGGLLNADQLKELNRLQNEMNKKK